MELKEEFDEAVKAIDAIDFSSCSLTELNVFETTIRYLGGFLSAYDLSGNKALLKKAQEMGDMLYVAFDTPNRMPITRWKFREVAAGIAQDASPWVLVAEIGSLTLEFTRLSQATGNPKYYDAVQRVMDVFDKEQMETHMPGMWPVSVNARSKNFRDDSSFTISGMADSTYEYLPKQHMLLGGGTEQYRKLYENAVEAMKKYIFYRPMVPDGLNILFPGQPRVSHASRLGSTSIDHEAQHLGCFAGGMVGIGSKIFNKPEDLDIAHRLVEGCLWGYEKMPLGIMPEIMHLTSCPDRDNCTWNENVWVEAVQQVHGKSEEANMVIQRNRYPKGVTKVDDARYILR
jgi:mannosyl-oligosaccharide alpha-1,2-mannosidase